MKRSTKILVAKAITLLSVIPAAIYAHSAGAPARHTGAPGDLGTCVLCHAGTAGTGKVEITYSGGTSYVPGERGRFTVLITDSAARRWGFEATARLVSNLSSGQAGTLIGGTGTQVVCQDDRAAPCRDSAPLQFITHNPAASGANPFKYEFDWTPPATNVGDVRVYVAANAANGNGAETGDKIYTSNITLTPSAGGANRPTISEGGVADAFTYQRGVSSGAWTAIFGENLSSSTRNWDGSPEFAQGRLPVTLDGVSVTINGKPAPVFFISPGQVNVLAPTDDTTGNVQVVVKNANGESAPITIGKTTLLPALYAPFGQNGQLFVTGVENSTGAILGKSGLEPRAARAFRPGDVVQFYATGLGPTNPPKPADLVVGTPAALVNDPSIRINDVPAQVLGAALVGSGLYQVNAQIPDVPNGDQPIVVEIGGVRSSNTVLIPIQR